MHPSSQRVERWRNASSRSRKLHPGLESQCVREPHPPVPSWVEPNTRTTRCHQSYVGAATWLESRQYAGCFNVYAAHSPRSIVAAAFFSLVTPVCRRHRDHLLQEKSTRLEFHARKEADRRW